MVAQVDDWLRPRLESATSGDILGSEMLSWDSRTDADVGLAPVALTDPPRPMPALSPGPVNEDLARVAAEFVARHPVPIIARWESTEYDDRSGQLWTRSREEWLPVDLLGRAFLYG